MDKVSFKINKNVWIAKLFVGLYLSGTLSASDPRNFFTALKDDGLELLSSPARWDWKGWALAGAGGGAVVVMAAYDVPLYHAWRGRQDWLDATMPPMGELGDGAYAAAGTAGLWALSSALEWKDLQGSSASALEGLALVGLLSPALKSAFAAHRPDSDDQAHRFFDYRGPYPIYSSSFPSGHSMVAFSLAESFGSRYGRWWTYPLAAATAYSRVYRGAHWPSDVAFGALLGLSIGHLCARTAMDKGWPLLLWGAHSRQGTLMLMAGVNF